MKYCILLPILVSAALMTGCASGGYQTSSNDSTPVSSDSASDSFNETQQRINDQMAVDAANAPATQQNNDAMAAAQQTENQHNAEFQQNSLQ